MPLLDELKAAICRITSTDGATLNVGTGFLIDDRHVLTAFHVVGNSATRTPFPGPFTLEFGPRSGGRQPFVTRATSVVDSGPEADWAILEATPPPPATITPLRVRSIPPKGYLVNWSTWAFPIDGHQNADYGSDYSGTVTSSGKVELTLFSQQAVEKEASKVRGMSGSPCIVDGSVVGVIIAADDPAGAGQTVGGTVFALPIDTVAAASSIVKLRETPPFVDEVAGFLNQNQVLFALERVARDLGVPVGAIDRTRLPWYVAEKLMELGFDATVDNLLLLGTLKGDSPLSVVDCAGSLWIDSGAAALIEQTTSGARVPIALNVSNPDTAKRYLHRAGYQRARHPGWKRFAHEVPPPAGEPQEAGLMDEVADVLCHRLKCTLEELTTELKNHDHVKRPIFVLLPAPPATAPTLEGLQRAFDGVHFVLLLGADVPDAVRTAFTAIRLVEPLLDRETEKKVLANYQRRRNEVERFFKEDGATG
jgi:Trypsin-like peptidase domain